MASKLYLKPQVFVRLHKVSQTPHLWVFTFRDPINNFMQSAIVSKAASWEATATIWEKIHITWQEALKDRPWTASL